MNDLNLSEDQILYNLSRRGYRLSGAPDGAFPLVPAEDLIISILKLRDPRAIYGIPVVLSNTEVDYERLIEKALGNDVANELGHVLFNAVRLFDEERTYYGQIKDLKKTVEYLKKHISRGRPHVMISADSPSLETVLASVQTPEERDWNVSGRVSYGGFVHSFDTYRPQP